MKQFSLLVSLAATLAVFPISTIAQADDIRELFSQEVAKSGCCKVRKSTQHPWAQTNQNFEQCGEINKTENDKIYESEGLTWWDRSC